MLPNLFRWRQTGSMLAGAGRALSLLLFAAAPALAQGPVAVGGQFQVNTYTTQDQRQPAVAMDAQGDFVVVWSNTSGYGLDTGILAQRYDSSGAAVGGEFEVSSYPPGNTTGLAVAADTEGDFVVVWAGYGSAPEPYQFEIQGQRFASSGAALGGQFQVNTYTTDYQIFPAVASDPGGDFVVVWESFGSLGSDVGSYSIQARRYASDGTALGGQFQVNTYTTSAQSSAAVAGQADGGFVVVWESFGSSGNDTSQTSIQGQRYASDGTALGGEFEINAYTTSTQGDPAIARDADGDFVVAWHSNGSFGDDASQTSIQAQRYASDGTAVGGQLQVNTYTTGSQRNAAVAADADGDFLVAWAGAPLAGDEIHARHFASNATPTGDQFAVNSYTSGSQDLPAVSASEGGGFVVAWPSAGSPGSDSSGLSIQGQRYYAGPVPVPSLSGLGAAAAAALMLLAVARAGARRTRAGE